MIVNKEPYPISFELQVSQALVCRYGEELRQYKMKPDIDISGLSCLLQIAKPDGTFTENGVDVITDEDGKCYLILTIPKQATVVKGVAKYSICCYGEIETEMHLLYSAEGPLWVDDDLITEEMIQSVAEVNGYTFPQDFFTVDMIPDIVDQIIPLVTAEVLDDETTSETTTWSSTKIYDEITEAAGATTLGDLADVNISDPEDDDVLVYDNVEETWKNAAIPGHAYSTTEHVVGKWIDGSNIYERVYPLESPISISASGRIITSYIDNISEIDKIRPNCVAYGDNDVSDVYINFNSGIMTAYIGVGMSSCSGIILRYSKTA